MSKVPCNSPKNCNISERIDAIGVIDKNNKYDFELLSLSQIASIMNIYENSHSPAGRLYLIHS